METALGSLISLGEQTPFANRLRMGCSPKKSKKVFQILPFDMAIFVRLNEVLRLKVIIGKPFIFYALPHTF